MADFGLLLARLMLFLFSLMYFGGVALLINFIFNTGTIAQLGATLGMVSVLIALPNLEGLLMSFYIERRAR